MHQKLSDKAPQASAQSTLRPKRDTHGNPRWTANQLHAVPASCMRCTILLSETTVERSACFGDWPVMDETILDCLIIGGGPAGLTAAIYLARFHLDILVVDGGKSRTSWIPCSATSPGFPTELGAPRCYSGCATKLVDMGRRSIPSSSPRSSAIRIAACSPPRGDQAVRRPAPSSWLPGVTNRKPPMDEDLHDDALSRGLVRYCPICDGYEVTDKKIGVIGSDSHGVAEALFIRSFTADVTLIAPDKALQLKAEDYEKLRAAGIECVDGPAQAVAIPDGCIIGLGPSDGHYTFDSIYPALGSDTHTQLAEMVKAEFSNEACIKVDSHQRTSVPGLYAAGDVVIGLDQISHAMGEGGVAATTIRNDLARENPILREPLSEMREAGSGSRRETQGRE